MNAAARLLNQSTLSRGWAISLFFTRAQFTTIVMILALLTSALSVIYITNVSRGLNSSLEQAQAEQNHLHVQWAQLLLEKSTWMMPARVQQIAESKYKMVLPDAKSVIVIHPSGT
ncbi:MAG: cell division protein FtsL [Gammaproteobacteria bacterium]|nr:cell division protein FtsL [Gammaproteobacteria bacterium]